MHCSVCDQYLEFLIPELENILTYVIFYGEHSENPEYIALIKEIIKKTKDYNTNHLVDLYNDRPRQDLCNFDFISLENGVTVPLIQLDNQITIIKNIINGSAVIKYCPLYVSVIYIVNNGLPVLSTNIYEAISTNKRAFIDWRFNNGSVPEYIKFWAENCIKSKTKFINEYKKKCLNQILHDSTVTYNQVYDLIGDEILLVL